MNYIYKFNTKQYRISLFIILSMFNIFLLNACSPLSVIVSSSGEQPIPRESWEPAAGYQPVSVDRVEVEVGVGSPIPVDIVISGTWPDLCAQIAEVKNSVSDFQIDVTILASTSSACPPDLLGLPFLFEFPLNTVEMPEGVYSISVNGITGTTLGIPLKP